MGPGDERRQRLGHYCIQFNGSSVISSLLNCKLNDNVCAVMEVSVGYFVCLYDLYHCRMEPLIPKALAIVHCVKGQLGREPAVFESPIFL